MDFAREVVSVMAKSTVKMAQSLTFYDISYSETWTGPARQVKETKIIFFSGARKKCPLGYDI